MRHRHFAASLIAVALVGWLTPDASAQAPRPEAPVPDQTVPRTADGRPDLSGYWTTQTFTPMERPEYLGDKAFYTEEEWTQLQAQLTVDGADPLARSVIEIPDAAERERIRTSLDESLLVEAAAGTGKTYLAMAMAVAALNRREVSRLILVRPAVEAGEKLGFLPGDLIEKVNPYMRPLYDALRDLMDFGKVSRLIERDVIEVAPLAFMRGRTLNDAFVILDEAQNTTREQMKMFLTRLGFNSKAVITGDITQIDLPAGERSGMIDAIEVLRGVEGIGKVEFTRVDVVRHPLVQSIVHAYEKASAARDRSAALPASRE